ncbi:MAG: DUF6765 family protein, partial [Paludibacter sp.]
ADTFAHFGFSGVSDNSNKVLNRSIEVHIDSSDIRDYVMSKKEIFEARFKGMFARIIPVGHASAYTFPDRPYLKWEYEYEESGRRVERNNTNDFIEASEKLHRFFREFVQDNENHFEA